jgi:cell division protein FtsW
VSIAFGAWALTVGLLLIQPDIGQTLLITTTFMAVFFMAGVPLKWVAALAAAGAAGVVGLYFAFSHMRDRLSRFLSPETTDTHQIDRASEAIRARTSAETSSALVCSTLIARSTESRRSIAR